MPVPSPAAASTAPPQTNSAPDATPSPQPVNDENSVPAFEPSPELPNSAPPVPTERDGMPPSARFDTLPSFSIEPEFPVPEQIHQTGWQKPPARKPAVPVIPLTIPAAEGARIPTGAQPTVRQPAVSVERRQVIHVR
ncbi:MAG: hypothetical protein KDA85_05590 [Planctomycetaceae bacterium]|nr:hypothetical protein [Planctomycetaceae bacterium]